MLRVNAHIHLPPNFSAFDSVEQALDVAAAQKVLVLGASNYYDWSVYESFAAHARKRGIFPLFGLETIALIDELVQADVKINDPGNPGKMYLCGKGISGFHPMSDDAARLLRVIRDNDGRRMREVAAKLAGVFADAGVECGLTDTLIKDRVARRHHCPPETVTLQERHLAQAFQQELFKRVGENDRAACLERLFGCASRDPLDAVAVQNEIRSNLMKAGKKAFAPDTFVNFEHSFRLILALGGIPCYPTLADGANPICPFEEPVEALIARLKERSIPCAEFIPNRNKPEVLSHYVRAIRGAGLFVTAGTEHNTLDTLPMEPTCAGGAAIPDDVKEIFWEGACVVAAHQYFRSMDRPGFLDARDPITSFARTGAAVIARYND